MVRSLRGCYISVKIIRSKFGKGKEKFNTLDDRVCPHVVPMCAMLINKLVAASITKSMGHFQENLIVTCNQKKLQTQELISFVLLVI